MSTYKNWNFVTLDNRQNVATFIHFSPRKSATFSYRVKLVCSYSTDGFQSCRLLRNQYAGGPYLKGNPSQLLVYTQIHVGLALYS